MIAATDFTACSIGSGISKISSTAGGLGGPTSTIAIVLLPLLTLLLLAAVLLLGTLLLGALLLGVLLLGTTLLLLGAPLPLLLLGALPLLLLNRGLVGAGPVKS